MTQFTHPRPIPDACYHLAKEFEGEVLHVYKAPEGNPTAGIGHLVVPSDGLKLGDKITAVQSMALYKHDAAEAAYYVCHYVKVPFNDNQYAALIDIFFNEGVGTMANSTLLAKLNSGDHAGAAEHFVDFNKAHDAKTGQFRVFDGLTRRRLAEKTLFLS